MSGQVNTYEDGWVNSIKGAPRGTFKRGSAARDARDAPWRVKFHDRKENEKVYFKKKAIKNAEKAFKEEFEMNKVFIEERNFFRDTFDQDLDYDEWLYRNRDKYLSSR